MRRSLAVLSLVFAACNPRAFDDFVDSKPGDAGSPLDAASLDAGDLATLDATPGRDGAQPDASTPAPEPDPCGQYRPRTPAQSGIEDGGVVFAGTIAQSTQVSPRWPSALMAVGDDYWWIFGPAFRASSLAVLATDSITRSSAQLPYALREAAADAPAPMPFLPTLEADRAMLANEQLTHGTGSLIATGPHDGLLFYAPAALSGSAQGLTLRNLGTRVANVHIEGTQAQASPLSSLLFGPALPAFRFGMRDGGFVYLYGCQLNVFLAYDCMVARAPQPEATVGASYQFRTTAGWSSDFSAATFVLPGARDELSISFNPFLQRYLAVHLRGFDPVLQLRTAQHPDGPWEPFAEIDLPPPAGGQITHFGGIEQPELATLCGRKLVLTYLFGSSGDDSELRRIEVLLREGPR